MKRSELIFSLVLVPLDFLMIVLAGISAYNIRFAQITAEIRPVIFSLPFSEYLQILLITSLIWLVIFAFTGLYKIKGTRSLVKEVYDIVMACSAGLVLVVIMIFFFRDFFSSRFIVLAAWLLAIVYVVIARMIVRAVQRILFARGIGVHYIILVGNSKSADILINKFSSQRNSGYEVLKRLRDFNIETAQELEEYIKTREVD